ncbi:DUF2303 family protein [Marinibacterium profundimaris]|uniref:DUF2303 family protein n=1 Tax=Marinibacterium profundimaris TaxID=1679460 RepID=A0A225NZX5_9RHOB|nr:DUF2303 family protein [Marinibacterium profundimaris]OWU77616.1 hypothetical protein ATO3_02740 [Marinibacterium profundimaris]
MDKTEDIPEGRDPIRELDAVIEAERISAPVVEGHNGDKILMLPRGFTTQIVEDEFALPPHIAASVTVDKADSHIAYINRFRDDNSILLADHDSGKIIARLDWHTHNAEGSPLSQRLEDAPPAPRHEDAPLAPRQDRHRTTFILRASEEYARWNEFEGKMHSQEEFARFLEENAVDIGDPEPSVMIEISRDLEASQGAKFSSKTRLENGDRAFTYETETHVKGDIVIPRSFYLNIPLYYGEDPVQLECLFRWRPTPAGLQLGFAWRRVEYMRRAYFEQIATRISEETGLPLFFGRTGGN